LITLKTKNAPFILGYVVVLYVGFAQTNGLDWEFARTMQVGKEGTQLDDPVLSMAFHVLALVLTYLLPSEWKYRLIYLRWRNPLPGSRAFTKLLDSDPRISRQQLANQYGVLPTSAIDQNSLWFKIYKLKQSDEVVWNSHGRWLLFRDMFAISAILFPPSAAFTFWHAGATVGFAFALVYLVLLGSLWICARNTGIRFTCNVLAR
jgi:hypothetical protein